MLPNVKRTSNNVKLCNMSSFIARKHTKNKLDLPPIKQFSAIGLPPIKQFSVKIQKCVIFILLSRARYILSKFFYLNLLLFGYLCLIKNNFGLVIQNFFTWIHPCLAISCLMRNNFEVVHPHKNFRKNLSKSYVSSLIEKKFF